MQAHLNILFICTGNTCRSPMAEHLLKDALRKQHLEEQVTVGSAGISASNGSMASNLGLQALQRRGIQADHRSKRVSADMVNRADLILTMTMSHKQWLVQSFPHVIGKVYTLKEYIHPVADIESIRIQPQDVVDPFGGDALEYEQCAEELEQAIHALVEKIQSQIG